MDLSIITVPWNVKDLLRDNLTELKKNTANIDYEVIAVDNKSADGSVDMLVRDFPWVNLVVNNYNAGFAKANNQGLEMASGRYVLLLNPDMRVQSGTLEGMVRWMDEHPEAGVAGCRLLSEDGETLPHVRRYPTVWDQLAIVLKLPHLFPGILNKYLYKDFDYSKSAVVDSIRGSFFMIRRELLDKIGGLDERFFIWFEEVDYCRRARAAGYQVVYTPSVECVDHIGKSFVQIPRGQAQRYFRDSMLKYFRKWHPAWQAWLLAAAWPLGILGARLGELVRFKRKEGTN